MRKTNSDKILFVVLFITLAIVVLSQIGLLFPKTRSVLTNVEDFEGKKIEENLTEGEKIVLSVCDGNVSEGLEIYVNGEKYSDFNENEKEVYINQTAVVEILSNNDDEFCFVEIKSISDKLYDTTKVGKVRIDKGFNMIGRFVK